VLQASKPTDTAASVLRTELRKDAVFLLVLWVFACCCCGLLF